MVYSSLYILVMCYYNANSTLVLLHFVSKLLFPQEDLTPTNTDIVRSISSFKLELNIQFLQKLTYFRTITGFIFYQLSMLNKV